MSDLARQRIRENIKAYERGLQGKIPALNLANCGLAEMPKEVEELKWLRSLSLSGNEAFSDLSLLSKLTNLQTLNLYQTQVSDLSSLSGLTNLQSLTLQHTRVSDLSPLCELTNLQTLNLHQTQVFDLSPLSGLTNLQSLTLQQTRVSDLSPLSGLTNLQSLNLQQTRVSDLSPIGRLKNLNKINVTKTEVFDLSAIEFLIKIWINQLKSKTIWQHINLHGCPIIIPPLEIIQQGNAAILNYFRERDEQGTDTLYEAKLLVVGEGGSGKTSLIRRLYQPHQSLPAKEDTTKGITIHCQDFPMLNGRDFRLNVWDFGGQEIYHATHQFFLTKRSLYVLLDNSRTDHKTVHDEGFRYWLEVIDNLSEHSPVLIFQNMDGGRSKDVDMPGIKGQFDNVKDLYRGDLLQNPSSVQPLREAVEFYVKKLPHIGEQLPKKWIDIRRDLEARAEQEAHISQDEYFAIYKKHLPFDREKALWLSRYLHDLGVFLHFQDETALRKTVVLQNQWATEAVFKVLDDEPVKTARGRFTLADCDRIWADSTYADMHHELLALMMKFELCYQLPDTRPEPDAWLTPGLLAASKPEALREWAQPGDLVLRYHYLTFKPKGLPNRLMVRMNRYVRDIGRAWRNGAYFQDDGNELLVEEPYNTSEIVLRVRGKDPKRLLTLIADDLDALNNGFGSLREKVKKKIPCICATCKAAVDPHFYDYDNLLYRKERGQRTAECAISFDNVEVAALLEGVFSKTNQHTQNQEDMPASTKTFKVFLSYSHKDEDLKNQLDDHLAALKNSGRVEVWNDRQILAGDDFNTSISDELASADIILFLVSSGFLSSKYIKEVEVPFAMERQRNKEARVIPIFLKPCEMGGTPFATLQGLPRDQKFVSNHAGGVDEALMQVAKGIRAVVEAG